MGVSSNFVGPAGSWHGGIISGEPMPCYRADGKGIKDCRMMRSIFRSMGGAFFLLAIVSGHAEAQRPAAWDTRVKTPAPPSDAPDSKSAPEQKDKARKAVDAPADSRTAKPKAN
jgi:hypothetical protein